MKTSVELQGPFMYMIIWVIFSVIFIAAVVAAQIILRKKLGDRLKREKQIRSKLGSSTLEEPRFCVTEQTYLPSKCQNETTFTRNKQ